MTIWMFKSKLKAFLKLTVWRFLLYVFGVWGEPFVFYPLSAVPAVWLVAYLPPTPYLQPGVPSSSVGPLPPVWSPYPGLEVLSLAWSPSLVSLPPAWSPYLQPGVTISSPESLPPAWIPYLQSGVPIFSLENLSLAWSPYLQPRVPISRPESLSSLESLPPVWSSYLQPGDPTSSLESLPTAWSPYLQPGVTVCDEDEV
jgi:hypothetical protein